jgi:hypothetical protein
MDQPHPLKGQVTEIFAKGICRIEEDAKHNNGIYTFYVIVTFLASCLYFLWSR